jgi:hypothetical protein
MPKRKNAKGNVQTPEPPRPPSQPPQPAQPVVPSKPAAAEDAGDERLIIYPEPGVIGGFGDNQITVDWAKEMLGWEVVTNDNKASGPEPLFKDLEGNSIRCRNNVNNRPIYLGQLRTLKQEILTKKWRMNGENIILGKTGLVLNGQHTLIALVLAEQERNAQKGHWQDQEGLTEPLTIDKAVFVGIDEDDDTINTMDTCKPRSLADVIYRSEFFRDKPGKSRLQAAKMTEGAIRILWNRTGVSRDQWAPRRTHSNALDFLSRHQRLLEAVNHIMDTDKEQSISGFLKPGGPAVAVAAMYLMGTSASDGDYYADEPSEERVDFSNWDTALEFWTVFGGEGETFRDLKQVIRSLADEETGTEGSIMEKMVLLAKAWDSYANNGQEPTTDDLKLSFAYDDHGVRTLEDDDDFGGIDLGEGGIATGTGAETEDEGPTPTEDKPEVLEERKAQERERRTVNAASKNGGKTKAAPVETTTGQQASVGSTKPIQRKPQTSAKK